MRRHKIILGIALLSTFLCTACSHSKPQNTISSTESNHKANETYFAGNLSESDMEESHLSLTLTENVFIDADITPYNTYKDGLNSYFLESFVEMKDADTEEAIQDYLTTIFHQSVSDIAAKIEKYSNTTADFSKQTISSSLFSDITGQIILQIPLQNSTGDDWRDITCAWAWLPEDATLDGAEFYYYDTGTEAYNFYTLGDEILLYTCKEESNLAFADAQVLGEALREWLEELFSEELSEEYLCIPVTERVCEQLDASADFITDYYFYRFYRQIDGFTWKEMSASMKVEKNALMAKNVEKQGYPEDEYLYLTPLRQIPQDISYDQDGIRYLALSKFSEVGDMYQSKKAIVNMNQLLEAIKNYYDDQLLLYPITLQKINLCYASYFSAPEDGEIRNIVQPFWQILYYDEQAKQTMQFWIDAYTGTFVSWGGLIN